MIDSIKNNERCVTFQKIGNTYRVDNKFGVDHQYWIIDDMEKALEKFNEIIKTFEEK